MSDPLFALVMVAADLKLAAPAQYDRLVASVKIFEEKCREDLQAADAVGIFQAQGKAQAVTQLRTKLEQCIELRAKYEARK